MMVSIIFCNNKFFHFLLFRLNLMKVINNLEMYTFKVDNNNHDNLATNLYYIYFRRF